MRSLVKPLIGVVALAAMAVTGCGANGGGGGDSKQIRLYADGDVNVQSLWKDNLIPGFEKANPGYTVKMTFDEHGQNSTTELQKLAAAVKTKRDFGFDLLDSGIVSSAVSGNLLAKPDPGKLPNLVGVNQDLLSAVKNMAVPYRGTAVALAYNTEHVKTPPKTLDDLLAWIKAHPGKFTYNSPNSGGSGGAFVTTVVDHYVPEAARQKMTLDYDKADEKYWKKGLSTLKDLKPSIYQHVYPNGNQAVLDLLAKDSIWMCPAWIDQTLTAQQAGDMPKSIALTQISDPSFTGGGSYLGIPKTTKRSEAANKLINYVLGVDAQAQIVKVMSGFPVIDLSKLPKSAQGKFEGLSNKFFRPGYQSNVNNDLNAQWQSDVA
ncbi:MAG TPA: extracellular solute-binding protein [Mycobacteriales bacterium]|nr:extracellular solute-binding protein [Mycobacteriales bacterium]